MRKHVKLTFKELVISVSIFTLALLAVICGKQLVDKVSANINRDTNIESVDELSGKTHVIDEILENRFLIINDEDKEYIVLYDGTLIVRENNENISELTIEDDYMAILKDVVTREETFKLYTESNNTEGKYFISYKDGNKIRYCSSDNIENQFGRLYNIVINVVYDTINKTDLA